MIYVLAEDETSAVKIGSSASSRQMKRRLIKLNEGNSRPLVFVAIADGGRLEEKQLHARFKSERLRGEWFARGPSVQQFIERNRIDATGIRQAWPRVDVTRASEFKCELMQSQHAITAELERRERVKASTRVHRCSTCDEPDHYASSCRERKAATRRTLLGLQRRPKLFEWRGKSRVA